jgi:hypothetical protein
MYQQFVNLKSAFQLEVDSAGIILYEKNDCSVETIVRLQKPKRRR